MSEEQINKAGSVKITELKLVSHDNIIFDLTDFLVELNIFEDMFSNYLYGNMVLSDSFNLIEKVPILGEEFLILNVNTPSLDSSIRKTFRLYKTSDRNVVRDNNTQTYTLHFASIELFFDMLLPLFIPFEGLITDVVANIFENYISQNRNFQISEAQDKVKEIEFETPLFILNETSNKVKFISPGWTPFKCINWLASKSIPKDGQAKNYLFFESSKAFYFGTVEFLFKENRKDNLYIGRYSISASNLRDGNPYPNLNREYFLAKNVEMVESTDGIKNFTNGYLGSRLITLDINNKEYKVTDYDYVKEYSKQVHSSGNDTAAVPIFTNDSIRNFASDISFYPVQPKLFNNFPNNVSEKMSSIHGNRKSSLLDLTNIKMNITVPGRTDVEVGRMLYFSYPSLGSGSFEDKVLTKEDVLYSGYYIITAIHHKINKVDHSMIMECVKDSLYVDVNV